MGGSGGCGDIYKLGIGHAWGWAREECGGKILCKKQIILKYVRLVVFLFSEASIEGWVDIFPCRRIGKRHYYYGYYFTGISTGYYRISGHWHDGEERISTKGRVLVSIFIRHMLLCVNNDGVGLMMKRRDRRGDGNCDQTSWWRW